ncbi:MAG: hypothetical protein AAGA09_01475 [Pseudomonadota bacterium]
MKKLLFSALAGAVATGVGAAGSATSLVQMDLQSIVSDASVIVVATAMDREYVQTEEGVHTITTFDVSDTVLGAEQETLRVSVPGGVRRIGKFKVAETWAGAPLFLRGSEALMFLTDRGDGDYRVVGFSQGSAPVHETIEGKMVQLPGDNAGPMQLGEAIGEIMKAADSAQGTSLSLE